jgi:hypothetical protein
VPRWDIETDPDARAALLIALPARSPDVVAPGVPRRSRRLTGDCGDQPANADRLVDPDAAAGRTPAAANRRPGRCHAPGAGRPHASAGPHDHAVRIAIEIRDPAQAPVLRNHLAGPLTPLTARTLLAQGVDRADLTEPVLHWLTRSDQHDPIVAACTDLLDPTALPRLHAPADSDERVRTGGDHSSVIWRDERHRNADLAGTAAIEARS